MEGMEAANEQLGPSKGGVYGKKKNLRLVKETNEQQKNM